MFRYSLEHKEFISTNIHGRYVLELTSMFNEKFDVEIQPSQMRAFIKNNGLKSGIDARIKLGSVPPNKGKKKLWSGGENTQFKKGHKPHNYVPIGSERVNGDDYVDIKVADPNKWRGKHLIVWEQRQNRTVPKGHAVIFGDGNRRNFDPDNLILVTRGQLVIMNKRGLIQKDAELTRSGVILADIIQKMGERKRSKC
ncbi:HNH endonuclease signature motif containing protein [Paenibacillus odorifer]|uniref:HNH endonuclease signature motif containing protein n=1 Tax=Paenibacillus odorifer TaxID=189426 RepID=UPI002DBD39B5|nr:HNH endonuclease signature motif containing protein [Paenibacillus odorifer]MEC0131512.1 HNH endonuclease signature motif containing protein [Paenibacillus odorifer]MEC0220335.1 HNH endonuclease signature motif containing protein [Paenibacillus odorifer]